MEDSNETHCPVTHCMSVIGGKWKPIILHEVRNKVGRFGALQRAIPKISKQMLTQQLRELESDDILNRKVFAEIPPRVEYSITKRGQSLLQIIDAMKSWGEWDLAADENDEGRDQLKMLF